MKYIPVDTLIAEIERLYDIAREASYNGEIEGEMTAYDKILSFITSLQQKHPEVDLNKEVQRWKNEHGVVGMDDLWLNFARHFWNKGYNARKEEDK